MKPSNSWELQHLQQRLCYMACSLALPKRQSAHHGMMQIVHAL